MGFDRNHKIISVLGGLIVLIAVAACAGSSKSNTALSSGTPTTSAAATPTNLATAAAAPSTQAPASSTAAAAPSTQAPASPAMTTAQQQAVEAAQGYLQMGSGFSYESLLNQLTSSSGSGFSTADATYAINYLHPDWDQQAVEAAKGYIQMGGFSRESLIQQLTSTSGNGFTEAQAEYAASQVGL